MRVAIEKNFNRCDMHEKHVLKYPIIFVRFGVERS
jgi:hypothetical protein